jgi:hypothetical protein
MGIVARKQPPPSPSPADRQARQDARDLTGAAQELSWWSWSRVAQAADGERGKERGKNKKAHARARRVGLCRAVPLCVSAQLASPDFPRSDAAPPVSRRVRGLARGPPMKGRGEMTRHTDSNWTREKEQSRVCRDHSANGATDFHGSWAL